MVIAVNVRLLLKEKLEGIGCFAEETLKRITTRHPEHRFVFFFDRPFHKDFLFSDNITPVVAGPAARHPVLWYFWFQFQVPRLLKKYEADIFLSPDGFLSLRTEIPQLPVIHDINFMHRPEDLPWLKRKYFQHFFPKFAGIARRVVTVSSFSGSDISRFLRVDPEKIDVVYNGVRKGFIPVNEAEQKVIRNRYSEGMPYFFFIGALHPRKNVEGLLKAFEHFKRMDAENIKLIVAGGKMHKTDEIFRIHKNMDHRKDVIFTGRISTVALQKLMGAALALTFVPFFEGFGIPVIEAMRTGIPVICSNTTSLPEVGGNAVFFVDPGNKEEISDAMQQIATNSELRQSMILKGFEQVKNFSWEKTAGLLWKSIERVFDKPMEAKQES